MSEQLYRQQVLERLRDQKFGSTPISQPLAMRISVIAFAVMLGVAIIFCGWATVPDSQMVRGVLMPIAGAVKVYSASEGQYEQILVKEGELVEKGQLLAKIASNQRDRQGAVMNESILAVMRSNREGVARAIELERDKFTVTKSVLTSRIAGMRAQLDLMQEEYKAQIDRESLAREDYERRKDLVEKKLISTEELNAKRSAYLSFVQQLSNFRVRMEEQSNALMELQASIRVLPIEHDQQLVELSTRLGQLDVEIAEQQQRSRSTVVAPIAGRVSAISSVNGESANPRTPLLIVVPPDQPLEAEIYVPARSAGRLVAGQSVRISYDAFPVQTYGTYEARIRTISDSVIDPREYSLGISLSEPVYIVHAELIDQTVSANDVLVNLQAGSSFSGDVVLSEHTILRWIFDPMFKLASRM